MYIFRKFLFIYSYNGLNMHIYLNKIFFMLLFLRGGKEKRPPEILFGFRADAKKLSETAENQTAVQPPSAAETAF